MGGGQGHAGSGGEGKLSQDPEQVLHCPVGLSHVHCPGDGSCLRGPSGLETSLKSPWPFNSYRHQSLTCHGLSFSSSPMGSSCCSSLSRASQTLLQKQKKSQRRCEVHARVALGCRILAGVAWGRVGSMQKLFLGTVGGQVWGLQQEAQ